MKIVRKTEVVRIDVREIEIDDKYIASLNSYINENFSATGVIVHIGDETFVSMENNLPINIMAEDIADLVEGNARDGINCCLVKGNDPAEYGGLHIPLSKLILDLLEMDLACFPAQKGDEIDDYSETSVER